MTSIFEGRGPSIPIKTAGAPFGFHVGESFIVMYKG